MARKKTASTTSAETPVPSLPFSAETLEEINQRREKRTGGKVSIKEFDVTEYILSEVEQLSGLGFAHKDLYSYFGLSHAAWFNWLKLNPVVSDRIRKGRAKMLVHVVSKLMELINKGNYKAISFYLTNRHGWRDTYTPGEDDVDKPLPQNLASVSSVTSDPVEASKVYQQIMTRSVKNGGDRTH